MDHSIIVEGKGKEGGVSAPVDWRVDAASDELADKYGYRTTNSRSIRPSDASMYRKSSRAAKSAKNKEFLC